MRWCARASSAACPTRPACSASRLEALSNDIRKNLQAPLAGICDELFAQGLPDVDVRAWVRTGDTPQHERQKMRRQPPHILVTTPESAYILLTSDSGREMLASVRTVIVDATSMQRTNPKSRKSWSIPRRTELVRRGRMSYSGA